jgi:hypothetical protein
MGIIHIAKDVVDIVQKIANADQIQKVLELQTQVQKIVDQLKEKEKIIEELRYALELKGKMKCENSAYWIIDDQDNKVDGPFCTNCFDREHVMRRLILGGKPNGEAGRPWEWVKCPICNVPFRSKHVGIYLKNH